jgi:hypothetical protein
MVQAGKQLLQAVQVALQYSAAFGRLLAEERISFFPASMAYAHKARAGASIQPVRG